MKHSVFADSFSARSRRIAVVVGMTVLAGALAVMAQSEGVPPPGGSEVLSDSLEPGGLQVTLWGLFTGSADLFTVLLLVGSLIVSTVIVRCFIQVRAASIVPEETVVSVRRLIASKRFAELKNVLDEEDSMFGQVMRAALRHPGDDRTGVREAAEMLASEQCAGWFRRIEPLSIIGNLGPLLGLAGTVWGMIIAFASLGATGGRAGPADLSLGISKALFHTLLGLLLAVPALSAHGFFRAKLDKLCTRAMVLCGELIEQLPTRATERAGMHASTVQSGTSAAAASVQG